MNVEATNKPVFQIGGVIVLLGAKNIIEFLWTGIPSSGLSVFEMAIEAKLLALVFLKRLYKLHDWLPDLVVTVTLRFFVLDLNDVPLKQMESIMEQLGQMRISIGLGEGGEGILSRQKVLVAGNKADIPGAGAGFAAVENTYGGKLTLSYVSARDLVGLEEMKRKVFQVLGIIRVYTKTPGQKPDMDDPIILPKGSTLADAAEAVHKDFRARLKYARLWGSGKHDGIMVKRDHVLQDGDIIELHV